MLDYRIHTFLKLCDVLNYRITAEELNLTQPAVTHHIQYLEKEYNRKLFIYSNRKLEKTDAAVKLEEFARVAVYNDLILTDELKKPIARSLRIGATKSIAGYDIKPQIEALMTREDIEFSLYSGNTKALLEMIDHCELDIALVEGFFDRKKYGHTLYKRVPYVGICSDKHPFAGKSVHLNDIFNEHIIVREQGSGTRAVFEQLLLEKNCSLKSFKKTTSISSFELIKAVVSDNFGISFVYDVVAKSAKNLSTFHVENAEITREFNFVFLKNTHADIAGEMIKLFSADDKIRRG